MKSTRRTFLAGGALFLTGAVAGCLGRAPRSTTQSRSGAGSGPGGGGTMPRRSPTDGSTPSGPNRTPYGPDEMPHDPNDMPHSPGSMPHHGEWTTDDGDDDTSLDQWFSDVDNYTGVVDGRGRPELTVTVGASGNGGAFAYEPAAVRVSPGTRIVWEWTGDGGFHDVAATDGSFASDLLGRVGDTFTLAPGAGTYRYYCTPHRSLGMKGAVVVD